MFDKGLNYKKICLVGGGRRKVGVGGGHKNSQKQHNYAKQRSPKGINLFNYSLK